MSEETPRRTIRIPNHRWHAAKTRADENGTTISEVVNNYLEEYGQDMNPPGTQQQP